jgi:hypothetical protein
MIAIPDSARLQIQKALSEIQKGNNVEAQKTALQVSESTPGFEDPWLILAYLAEPGMGFKYIKNALAINPDSKRARAGVHYLIQKALNNSGQRTGEIKPGEDISEKIISEQVQRELIFKPDNPQQETELEQSELTNNSISVKPSLIFEKPNINPELLGVTGKKESNVNDTHEEKIGTGILRNENKLVRDNNNSSLINESKNEKSKFDTVAGILVVASGVLILLIIIFVILFMLSLK